MAQGLREEEWIHTTHLLATIVNFSSVRDPKAASIKFDDIYPFSPKPKAIHDMESLKAEWMSMVKQQQG